MLIHVSFGIIIFKTLKLVIKSFSFKGEDFYEFSCGNFIKRKRIPHDKMSTNILETALDGLINTAIDLISAPLNEFDTNSTRNAKNLYHSCLNECKIKAS